MNLLSTIKRKIIKILKKEDMGIYRLSKILSKSVSEVWRQMKQLQNLGIVKAIKKGEKYRIFKLNQLNPITNKLLQLIDLIDFREQILILEKKDGILIAIDGTLQEYYISSINILDSYSWDIPLELNVIRLISIEEEKEKIQLLNGLSNTEIRCTYLSKKKFSGTKFYKEKYNFAILEQAIIDALASNCIDEIDFAIQVLYLANINFKFLYQLATSQYDGVTLPMIQHIFLFAKTFGLSFPISLFDAKTRDLDKYFKNRVMQNFYRIYLGNGVAQRIKLY